MQSFKLSSLLCSLLFATSHTEASRGHNIVNAGEHEFPFVVSISEANDIFEPAYNHHCTGSLISVRHVLTVAHCVSRRHYEGVVILVGSSDLNLAKKYAVRSWVTYNNWFFLTHKCRHAEQNDIAIITLEEEVDEKIAKPAILSYTMNDNLLNRNLTSVGWGDTEDLIPTSISRKLRLLATPNMQCTLRIQELTNAVRADVTNQYLCTQNKPWALIDEGDSGGPLLDEHNAVVAVNKATIPHFEGYGRSKEYVNENQFNLHMSVYYYRKFIQHLLNSQP